MHSLSARLLVLTIGFVMLAEVLIYAPSAARFRLTWMQERMGAAHLAGLAVEASPAGRVDAALERELLRQVGAHAVTLRTPAASTHMLGDSMPPQPAARFDLDAAGPLSLIWEAFALLLREDPRVIAVEGASPADPQAHVAMVLDEAPLRDALLGYSARILQLSIVISLLTAALVFLALRWLMVRPMQRLTEAMTRFRERPEDGSRILVPGGRRDEIGRAQRELAAMQQDLHEALRQRARLAALGEAVTKINHDLRNILATAQLVSDRLSVSRDPEVRRVTPTLLGAIDRAVDLCARVLEYARAGRLDVRRETVRLCPLLEEVGRLVATGGGRRWRNQVDAGLAVLADPAQLRRIFENLGRNAFEAGARTVALTAADHPDRVEVSVGDDGPGLPASAREHLFRPFAGSARAGGSGLGLAIAHELAAAHGGGVALAATGAGGTTFVVTLPKRRRPRRRLRTPHERRP